MVREITNQTKGRILSRKAKLADNFFKRLVGLMFRRSMDEDEVLIFKGAPSIHTCFMFFPIDIVFLDKDMRVIRICKEINPFRGVFCRNSAFTLEFPPQKASGGRIELGDSLRFSPPLS